LFFNFFLLETVVGQEKMQLRKLLLCVHKIQYPIFLGLLLSSMKTNLDCRTMISSPIFLLFLSLVFGGALAIIEKIPDYSDHEVIPLDIEWIPPEDWINPYEGTRQLNSDDEKQTTTSTTTKKKKQGNLRNLLPAPESCENRKKNAAAPKGTTNGDDMFFDHFYCRCGTTMKTFNPNDWNAIAAFCDSFPVGEKCCTKEKEGITVTQASCGRWGMNINSVTLGKRSCQGLGACGK
jgi:hypothetical protein